MRLILYKRDCIILNYFDTIINLREYFSFFADGYQFQPAFKNKQWDGKIRLIDPENRIRLGLWADVKDACEKFNIKFVLDPKIKSLNLNKEKFQGFVDNLNVHSGGEKIDPYDYQVDAAHFALEAQRCLLLSPTSSGKSLIQYILIRMYERILPNEKILIVVPTVGLVTQMQADFDDYSSEIEWSSSDSVHGIKAGVSKETDKHIVISTYQSLNKQSGSQVSKCHYPLFDNVTALFSATPVIVRTATYVYACTEWVDDAFQGKESTHQIYSRLLNPTNISLANAISHGHTNVRSFHIN